MKKLLLGLLVLLISCMSVNAYEIDLYKTGKFEELINRVGFTILNANKIPYRITFQYNSNKEVNACAHYRDKSIHVYKGIVPYIFDENELAAILAHEISHAVDYNQGAFRGYFSYFSNSLNPKKYETKADKRGVDYMVRAGYNPLAMITIGTKLYSQYRYDYYLNHPLGSKRVAAIYEYIYTKYPEYLVQNEYKDNIYYQNFLITSKVNRAKLEQKVKSGSRNSVKYQ